MTTATRPEGTAHGIPTTYRGTRFRSRLEARWAAFFDLIEWDWVYEPFDADGWIPDFLIQGKAHFLVEVGPCVDVRDYVAKGEKARAAYPPVPRLFGPPGDQVTFLVPDHWTLVVGVTPLLWDEGWRAPAAGILASSPTGETDEAAWWETCGECGKPAIWFTAWQLHPCRHETLYQPANDVHLFDLWSAAGNRVQWRSR